MENKREPTHDQSSATPEEALGKSFRRLREARGLSQEEIAKIMHSYGHSWRQTTVAKMEAGSRPLRVNEAVDLARVFGVNAGELMDYADRESEVAARLISARSLVERRRRRIWAMETELEDMKNALAEAEAGLKDALQDAAEIKTDGEH